jgi:hypothetical protein
VTSLTLAVKHVPSAREHPCAVCAAVFVPAEDSGSRVVSMSAPDQDPLGTLLCGGCYSKWTHGMSITLKPSAPRP